MTKKVKLVVGLSAKTSKYHRPEESAEIFELPDDAIIVGAGKEGYGSMASFILYVQPVTKAR